MFESEEKIIFLWFLDMSDTSDPNSDDIAKGFHIDRKGFHCIPCRCKRQFYHKESKTVKEQGKITTNTVEDRRNFKIGSGRHQSPDEIFKPENTLQTGSIEICDTGYGMGRKPTPEENQERIFKLETDVEEIKKDIEVINKNLLNTMD